jgi:DnaJ like chaperone protein
VGFLGKTIGAGVGFMFGGPIGAVLGGAIGHLYDKGKEKSFSGMLSCPHCHHKINATMDGRCSICGNDIRAYQPQTVQERQLLFYISLTSLAAKMAKADGVVTADEVAAFDQFVRNELQLDHQERKIIADIFNEAKNSVDGADDIAIQFKNLIGGQPQVYQMMLQLLFRIAMADGNFHQAEEKYIQHIASIFNIRQFEYEQIKALFIKSANNAYQVLGISPEATDAEVKKTYKKRVVENHPDKLIAKGVPQDFIDAATDKMAKLNKAYDEIRKERKF